jgi:TolB protein
MLPLLIALLTAGPVETDTAAEAKHLANIRQVTSGLPRAGEGYFSPNGESIVYQAYPVGYPFYQIYLQKLDEPTPRLLCLFLTRWREADFCIESSGSKDRGNGTEGS